jgi:prepilin-type N-terminal cleavage/methylation domain-containing protein
MRSHGFSLLEFLLTLSLLGSFLALTQRFLLVAVGSAVREVVLVENALTRARLLRFLEEDLERIPAEWVLEQGPGSYRWKTEMGERIYFLDRSTRRLHRRLEEGNFADRTVLLDGVEEFSLRTGEGEWLVRLRLGGESGSRQSSLPWSYLMWGSAKNH